MTDATTNPGAEGTPDTGKATGGRTAPRGDGEASGPETAHGADRTTGRATTPGPETGTPDTGTAGRQPEGTGREAGGAARTAEGTARETEGTGRQAKPVTPGRAPVPGAPAAAPRGESTAARSGTPGTRLLPHDESDKLEVRLRQAVAGFVDGPRDAVEEADHVVAEIAGLFTEAMTRRRRTLRMSWQDGDRAEPTHPDTEQLRLALRDYRELAERLLRG
ncbi:hypothetical protein OHB14_42690 [Streptomyces sp. NBC_01613]|uniref:hypothetical protein n=1 Tax=Streptomyces sp. NBC_01613 TaxID=2975896 RepID=UPI0038685B65